MNKELSNWHAKDRDASQEASRKLPPQVYSKADLLAAGYDPEQLLPRLCEVLALFELLVKLAPPNPDAVHWHAWAKSAELISEVKLHERKK